MTKKENIDNPNSCWNTSKDGDIIFVIKQQDKAGPATIRDWVTRRVGMGLNSITDAKLQDAMSIADEIETRQARGDFDGTYIDHTKTAGEYEKGSGV